jgi:hypothetical protein
VQLSGCHTLAFRQARVNFDGDSPPNLVLQHHGNVRQRAHKGSGLVTGRFSRSPRNTFLDGILRKVSDFQGSARQAVRATVVGTRKFRQVHQHPGAVLPRGHRLQTGAEKGQSIPNTRRMQRC